LLRFVTTWRQALLSIGPTSGAVDRSPLRLPPFDLAQLAPAKERPKNNFAYFKSLAPPRSE